MSTIANTILRRNSTYDTFAAIGRTLKRWWIAYMHWRLQQMAKNQLRFMSDRELKDIGLSRSQIEFAIKAKDEQYLLFTRYY